VSSNLPEFTSTPQQWEVPPVILDEPPPAGRDWAISILLLFATILTTSFAGLCYLTSLDAGRALSLFLMRPRLLLLGLPFSIPLIAILLAHELGHYLACRYYGMSCTPPFFIPVPLPISGTLGAFIKIKSRFINRKALFDIGIAGPLAGFMFVLPALWIGISFSRLVPKGLLGHAGLSFGEPIIFRVFGKLILGYSPASQDMIAHPIAMAAWVGLLATSLNLLPIWQLDGGHIAYAMIGRPRHMLLSKAALIAMIFMSLAEWQWPLPPYLLFLVLLLVFGIRSRFYHPSVVIEEDALGPGRFILGMIAYLILIISFMPVPVAIS
jgi:membrane-associated protease RseP (regulator of RpoE activity)